MDAFRKIAEDRIREAQENGAFDNLPGKGKPVDLRDYFNTAPDMRMAHNLLKNAAVLPQEIELKKEIELLKMLRAAVGSDEQRRRQITREINEKNTYLELLIERSKTRR